MIQQAFHVLFLVDGPHVHVHVVTVGVRNEPCVHHGQVPEAGGHLHRFTLGHEGKPHTRGIQYPEQEHFTRRGRRGDPGVVVADVLDALRLEGSGNDPVRVLSRPDDTGEAFPRGFGNVLQFDDHPRIGEGGQHLFERGRFQSHAPVGIARAAVRRPTVSRVKLPQRFPGHFVHAARSVGRAVHRGVVHDDQFAVTGGVHVEFQGVRPRFNGVSEGKQRVFRPLPRAAAVGDDQLSIRFRERMYRHGKGCQRGVCQRRREDDRHGDRQTNEPFPDESDHLAAAVGVAEPALTGASPGGCAPLLRRGCSRRGSCLPAGS